MNNLKPCPFCGGDADVQLYKRDPKSGNDGMSPASEGDEIYGAEVGCESVKCEVQPYSGVFGTLEKAAEYWNKRPSEDKCIEHIGFLDSVISVLKKHKAYLMGRSSFYLGSDSEDRQTCINRMNELEEECVRIFSYPEKEGVEDERQT